MIRNLIIFSAEVISPELQLYFGELPSAMVPFQDKLAIDYIYYENRNHYKNIFIVVYKHADLIRQHISNQQYDITVIALPKLGDLAYTLSHSLQQMENAGETTLIFGDTYVPYMSSLIPADNLLMYSYTEDCERWTVIDASTPEMRFIDKKKLPVQKEYMVVIGVFHIVQPKHLLRWIEQCSKDVHRNVFYAALEGYYNEYGFQLKTTDAWIDFGHSDKYFDHKLEVEARDFNEIHVNKQSQSLIKKSRHTRKLIHEIEWFLNLPEQLHSYIPSIRSYSTNEATPYVEMDYVNYLTLHEIFIYGNHTPAKWQEILLRLKQVNTEFRAYTTTPANASALLRQMYIGKTLERLEALRSSGTFDFEQPFVINGKNYKSLSAYTQLIPQIAEDCGLCESRSFSVIHGDFFLANILYDLRSNQVKLIDPRGEFGEPGIYGDNLYEWAKLAHSLDGNYDLIVSDRFDLFVNGNDILYNLHHASHHKEILSFFYEAIVDKADLNKVRLIQALLFFSMVPLHYNKKRRQVMMLAKAIELFHPYIENKI